MESITLLSRTNKNHKHKRFYYSDFFFAIKVLLASKKYLCMYVEYKGNVPTYIRYMDKNPWPLDMQML